MALSTNRFPPPPPEEITFKPHTRGLRYAALFLRNQPGPAPPVPPVPPAPVVPTTYFDTVASSDSNFVNVGVASIPQEGGISAFGLRAGPSGGSVDEITPRLYKWVGSNQAAVATMTLWEYNPLNGSVINTYTFDRNDNTYVYQDPYSGSSTPAEDFEQMPVNVEYEVKYTRTEPAVIPGDAYLAVGFVHTGTSPPSLVFCGENGGAPIVDSSTGWSYPDAEVYWETGGTTPTFTVPYSPTVYAEVPSTGDPPIFGGPVHLNVKLAKS
jgi:hypothetical protein